MPSVFRLCPIPPPHLGVDAGVGHVTGHSHGALGSVTELRLDKHLHFQACPLGSCEEAQATLPKRHHVGGLGRRQHEMEATCMEFPFAPSQGLSSTKWNRSTAQSTQSKS